MQYITKLREAEVLPEDLTAAIVTHCGSGGRGGKAQAVLQERGYTNVLNGGSPQAIAMMALWGSYDIHESRV